MVITRNRNNEKPTAAPGDRQKSKKKNNEQIPPHTASQFAFAPPRMRQSAVKAGIRKKKENDEEADELYSYPKDYCKLFDGTQIPYRRTAFLRKLRNGDKEVLGELLKILPTMRSFPTVHSNVTCRPRDDLSLDWYSRCKKLYYRMLKDVTTIRENSCISFSPPPDPASNVSLLTFFCLLCGQLVSQKDHLSSCCSVDQTKFASVTDKQKTNFRLGTRELTRISYPNLAPRKAKGFRRKSCLLDTNFLDIGKILHRWCEKARDLKQKEVKDLADQELMAESIDNVIEFIGTCLEPLSSLLDGMDVLASPYTAVRFLNDSAETVREHKNGLGSSFVQKKLLEGLAEYTGIDKFVTCELYRRLENLSVLRVPNNVYESEEAENAVKEEEHEDNANPAKKAKLEEDDEDIDPEVNIDRPIDDNIRQIKAELDESPQEPNLLELRDDTIGGGLDVEYEEL